VQGKDFMCWVGCADVRMGIVVDDTCRAVLCTRSAWLHSCARCVCVCSCVWVTETTKTQMGLVAPSSFMAMG